MVARPSQPLRPKRPLVAHSLGEGLGFGVGCASHLLLEPGGKLLVALERAGPVAGEHQTPHGNAESLFGTGIETQRPGGH
jgi:hypothetical protein